MAPPLAQDRLLGLCYALPLTGLTRPPGWRERSSAMFGVVMPGNRRALLCAAPAINYQSIENEHDVAPAEAGTHVRWIPAFAGMARL